MRTRTKCLITALLLFASMLIGFNALQMDVDDLPSFHRKVHFVLALQSTISIGWAVIKPNNRDVLVLEELRKVDDILKSNVGSEFSLFLLVVMISCFLFPARFLSIFIDAFTLTASVSFTINHIILNLASSANFVISRRLKVLINHPNYDDRLHYYFRKLLRLGKDVESSYSRQILFGLCQMINMFLHVSIVRWRVHGLGQQYNSFLIKHFI